MNVLTRELVVVPSSRFEFKLAKMVKAAEEAELDLRGWPVLWLGEEYVKKESDCVTYVFDKRDRIKLAWRMSRSGLLFLSGTASESFYEDDPNSRVQNLFDPVQRILEFTEDIAVLSRLYMLLGASPDVQLSLQYSWKGAYNRTIAYHGNFGAISAAIHRGRVVPFDSPSCTATVAVGVATDDIPSHVLVLFRDLFDDITNDLGDIDDEVITNWARKCLTRTI